MIYIYIYIYIYARFYTEYNIYREREGERIYKIYNIIYIYIYIHTCYILHILQMKIMYMLHVLYRCNTHIYIYIMYI